MCIEIFDRYFQIVPQKADLLSCQQQGECLFPHTLANILVIFRLVVFASLIGEKVSL